MGKDEILILIEQVLEKMEIEGVASEREFQLAVLLTLKLLLEKDDES